MNSAGGPMRRRLRTGTTRLLVLALLALVSAACNPIPPRGALAPTHSAAQREAILETFYSTVERTNDLIRQIDAETDTYVALGSQFNSQIASGDLLGAVRTVREAESISRRSADLTRQQIDIVDEALEECLPQELVELLGLHREEAVLMRDAFEAEAKKNRLIAEATEIFGDDPALSERLSTEAQDADAVRDRLGAEAETVGTRRVQREKEIFAGSVTPPRCD